MDLPESIWAQIFSHLSLKEWAKASGITRTTSDLTLHTVDVPPGLSGSGDSKPLAVVPERSAGGILKVLTTTQTPLLV